MPLMNPWAALTDLLIGRLPAQQDHVSHDPSVSQKRGQSFGGPLKSATSLSQQQANASRSVSEAVGQSVTKYNVGTRGFYGSVFLC